MNELEAVASGLTLAKEVLLAHADDDAEAAVHLIDVAPDPAVRWALAYLAAGFKDVVAEHHNDRPVQVARSLRRMAGATDNNILEAQMALLTKGSTHE